MKQTSPYYNTPTSDFYLDIYVDRPIPEHSTDRLIEIEDRYENRPDLLSYDLYGTPDYWWIFYKRNLSVINDPIFDMKPGLIIFVPTNERLRNLLS